MYQARERWQGSETAFAVAIPLRAPFGRAAPPRAPFRLVVDLAEELFTRRWWRGAATLALLSGGVGLLAPAPAALPGGRPDLVGEEAAQQYQALGLAPLGAPSRDTGRMAASHTLVEPLASAPERAFIELFATLDRGDSLARMLVRLGAAPSDAARTAILVHDAAPRGIAPGTSIAIRLGHRDGVGRRGIERVALRAGLDLDLVIAAGDDGRLAAHSRRIAVDTTPVRIRGRVGDGLYWSLRAAGVTAPAAADYLKALATQIDVGGDLAPDDRFDLVIAHRRAATGEAQAGPLLYAGVERFSGRPIQLLKWNVGGRVGWYEANSLTEVSSAFAWPVNAPITSNFGMRYHPILHFARMHRGIDFGARWGMPITASADGQVSSAGWSGGYGYQVRIAHGGGIATSYSHMSRMVVDPGTIVRQGQLIGYVGSTGLSTGPHLHYETTRKGLAVDPRSVRFATSAIADPGELQRFRARLKAILGAARG